MSSRYLSLATLKTIPNVFLYFEKNYKDYTVLKKTSVLGYVTKRTYFAYQKYISDNKFKSEL